MKLLIVSFLLCSLCVQTIITQQAVWSQWSECTATCSGGIQTRYRNTRVQRKRCNMDICPGIFGWPRIHFHGLASLSGASNNNERCYYENKYFPSMSPFNYKAKFIKKMHKSSPTMGKTLVISLDPQGNNHFFFEKTKVTAVCRNATDDCKRDLIINRKVQNLYHARFFDLDVDYQSTPEVVALTIHVDGAFAANCSLTQAYDYGMRVIQHGAFKINAVEDGKMSVKFKTHLTGIKWFDHYYETMFGNATQLAMTFTIDFYTFETKDVRLTGTIGKSFHNDPISGHAGRIMSGFGKKRNLKKVPFHFHKEQKIISMDLSKAILTGTDKSFTSSEVKKYYGKLGLSIELPAYFQDIVLLFQPKYFPRNLISLKDVTDWMRVFKTSYEIRKIVERILETPLKGEPEIISKWRKVLHRILFGIKSTHAQIKLLKCRYRNTKSVFLLLTKQSAFNTLFKSNAWYEERGGFYDIPLDYLPKVYHELLEESKLALLNYSSFEVAYKVDHADKNLFIVTAKSCNILAKENSFGINFQSLDGVRKRLSKGTSWPMTWIVTKYGKLLSRRAKLSLFPIKKWYLAEDCSPIRYCPPVISNPSDMLVFSKPRATKADGTVKTNIKVIDGPGNPRKCGIDGQIYFLITRLEYYLKYWEKKFLLKNHSSTSYNILDIGTVPFSKTAPLTQYETILNQCNGSEEFVGSQTSILVFDDLPESVMRKTCPSWQKDIQPIFQFYYNMFPTMLTNGIIDLRDRENVRNNLRMLNMSMFEFSWNHPHFMPVTRDLSPDKTELVRRWIECEAAGLPETETEEESLPLIDSTNEICGNDLSWNKTIKHIHELLQSAVLLEWYTIPPYLTAWFSIQEGRSIRAANILKSIYTEEMLHMTLAGNVLISTGGHPNFTNILHLPNYPTYLPSHGIFQIKPGLLLTLEPFSKNLVRDVFLKLEEPAPMDVQWVIIEVAYILKSIKNFDETFDNKSKQTQEAWDRPIHILSKSPNRLFTNTVLNKLGNISAFIFWERLFQYSTNRLKVTPTLNNCKSIGGYYAHVMLKLIQTETCGRIHSANAKSLFTGNPAHQLSTSQWYARAGVSTGYVFKVTGFSSALMALLTIVYEGEGSTPCGVFVKEVNKDNEGMHVLPPQLEKSHYIKFMELAAGKELVKVYEKKPEWSNVKCILISSETCACSSTNTCGQYCFIGQDLSVPSKSVWPMVKSPIDSLYLSDTSAKNINARFNQVYSNLLRCLETSFNGMPQNMATCSAIMKELQVSGKTLSSTSFFEHAGTRNISAPQKYVGWDHRNYTGPNATPTWTFKPFMEATKGVVNIYSKLMGKHVFC